MKKPVIILLHLGYWTMYLLLVGTFLVALAANTKQETTTVLRTMVFSSPMAILTILPGVIGFYSFYGFLFQRWLRKRKLATFFLAAAITVMLSGLLPVLILLVPKLPWHVSHQWIAIFSLWIFLTLLSTIHGVIGLVMKGFITWYDEIKLKEELQQKNLETELALLKSKLNPHFLFNTINNIDILIENDAARASLYLNKLSDILRFMLYETKTEEIPLQRELEYLEKYLDLQRIRTANPNFIHYSVEGESGNLMISPMLFISYIENAFKHAESLKSGNSINIRIRITAGEVRFYCENKYRKDSGARKDHQGLGNELLRKRLDLLYPGRHRLEVSDREGTYIVDLTVNN